MSLKKYDVTRYRLSVGSGGRTGNTGNTEALGLTVALLADLHDRPQRWMVEELQKAKPDIIAIAGDLVDGRITPLTAGESGGGRHSNAADELYPGIPDRTLLFLSDCAHIAPTYMSLGNHEHVLGETDIDEIRERGVVVLDNEYVEHAARIFIGGMTNANVTGRREFQAMHPEIKLDVASSGQQGSREHRENDIGDIKFLSPMEKAMYRDLCLYPRSGWLRRMEAEEGYKILICHNPEYWALQQPMLCNRSLDLVIAGHAHGGQIRIFGRGLFAPGQGLLPKFTAGVHSRGESTLVISRGLANTSRIPRVMNRPELVIVEV